MSQLGDHQLVSIILALHKVRRGRWWDHTNVSPDRLCRILRILSGAGYRFCDLDSGITSSDVGAIALTFDDGYAHWILELPDICAQFNARPTIYIPAGLIGKSNNWDYSSIFVSEPHLTTGEIRRMSDMGFEIGSHGWQHRALTTLTTDKVRSELVDSKNRLEDISGREVESISYPFGRVNSTVMEIAGETGYRYGLTTRWPVQHQSSLSLGRIMIYGFDTPSSVLRKLNGRLQWLERTKQSATSALAGGTVLFQRLSGRG
jgi:peptidoglycan/xylan/chitin deacetylase (PgdA/CDA1 family)